VKIPITLIVNGQPHAIQVEAHHTLLEVLRDDIGLTGTKECCSEGECGACTVLLGGQAVDSCIVLGVEADGKTITTVEGLASGGKLSALQQAFLDTGAVQCGFCIPGMLMSARHLLDTNANPTDDDIKRGLEGNLCRCAGYSRIIAAVKRAAKAEQGSSWRPASAGPDPVRLKADTTDK
jgi:carbon-monoxide dehydrogenase small subunit